MSLPDNDRLGRWRLVLGGGSGEGTGQELEGEAAGMDRVLDDLYNASNKRGGGLGDSNPAVNRWLGDIRRYFPASTVRLLQKDALERLHLDQMLLEPELLSSVEVDVNLAATLVSLKNVIPERTRDTARQVVRQVVEELQKKLRLPLEEAVRGALSRQVKNRRPKLPEIDWARTVQANLKTYRPDLQTIIPEKLIGKGRRGSALKDVILLMDQSGSMATSLVYAGVFGSVLASLRSVNTRLIAFDTSVADLSEHLHDPVELLFGATLGGGTDIRQALRYAQQLVQRPKDTILVLISDLFEGGQRDELLTLANEIQQSGLRFVTLLALNDEGKPFYDTENARAFAALDIPCFACTPDQFPDLMSQALQGQDLKRWARQHDLGVG